jgi:hypothetical protein
MTRARRLPVAPPIAVMLTQTVTRRHLATTFCGGIAVSVTRAAALRIILAAPKSLTRRLVRTADHWAAAFRTERVFHLPGLPSVERIARFVYADFAKRGHDSIDIRDINKRAAASSVGSNKALGVQSKGRRIHTKFVTRQNLICIHTWASEMPTMTAWLCHLSVRS